MSEKIYIRPEIIGGRLALVDQGGREVAGVRCVEVSRGEIGAATEIKVELVALSADGVPIK